MILREMWFQLFHNNKKIDVERKEEKITSTSSVQVVTQETIRDLRQRGYPDMAQKLLKAYYAEKEKTRRRLEKEMRRNDYLIHKKLCKRRKLCIECNSSLEKNKSPNESLCDGCYTKRKEYKQRKKRMRRKKLKRKYPYIGTEQECFSCGNRFKVKGKNSTACSEKCRRRMRMVELMRERGTYPKVPCPKCGLKFASEKGVKCHERKMHKDGGE